MATWVKSYGPAPVAFFKDIEIMKKLPSSWAKAQEADANLSHRTTASAAQAS